MSASGGVVHARRTQGVHDVLRDARVQGQLFEAVQVVAFYSVQRFLHQGSVQHSDLSGVAVAGWIFIYDRTWSAAYVSVRPPSMATRTGLRCGQHALWRACSGTPSEYSSNQCRMPVCHRTAPNRCDRWELHAKGTVLRQVVKWGPHHDPPNKHSKTLDPSLFPANTKYLYNTSTMLGRRRWAAVVQMLYKCCVFAV